jgi:hypothetical protein
MVNHLRFVFYFLHQRALVYVTIVVCPLIYNAKSANQVATLHSIVLKLQIAQPVENPLG